MAKKIKPPQKNKNQHSVLTIYKRLLVYIIVYPWLIFAIFISLVLTAALEPVMPYLLKPLLDEGLIKKNLGVLQSTAFYIILVAIAKSIIDYLTVISAAYLANKAIVNIRSDMFSKINRLSLESHNTFSKSHLLSKITYDANNVAQTLSNSWILIIKNIFIIIALLLYLFYISWQLTLIILVVAPIISFIIDKASKSMRSSNINMQADMANLTAKLNDSLAGFKEIKIYNTNKKEQAAFHAIVESLKKNTMKVVSVDAINVPLVQFIAAATLAFVIYTGSILVTKDSISTGEFVSFLVAFALIFEPVRQLTRINAEIQKGLAGAMSIFELLDFEEEINLKGNKPKKIQSHLTIENLNFSYKKNQPILNNLSLEIEDKKTTAIIGHSGAGKSTLVDLLVRFYQPESGFIKLDGIDISTLDLQFYRSCFGLVNQQVTIFNDTIANNIAYQEQGGYDEEKIIQAAIDANAWKFIQSLPDKLNTKLGENGLGISGGQKQRIALARAFYKKAKILILDEATSALDNISEKNIQQSLEKMKHKITIVIIAHRLSTIENADKIILLDKGQNIEQGSHQDLIKDKNSNYFKIYNKIENSTQSL